MSEWWVTFLDGVFVGTMWILLVSSFAERYYARKHRKPYRKGRNRMTLNREEIDYIIELRGVYDGWSIAVMKDGSKVNRWDKKDYPKRWAATQAVLDADGDRDE